MAQIRDIPGNPGRVATLINTWNSLPEFVISASTTDFFKNKLDKFWSNKDLIYNYKAELTGIENRSFINLD